MTTQRNYAKLLAFAKTKCPECKGVGGFTERTGPTDVDQYRCETCEGTGLVFLLPDSVRVECGICYGTGHTGLSTWYIGEPPVMLCARCDASGKMALDPTTGGDTWAQAVWPLLTELAKGRLTWADQVRYQHEYMTLRAEGYTTAALGVIWEAFVAAGIVKEEAS